MNGRRVAPPAGLVERVECPLFEPCGRVGNALDVEQQRRIGGIEDAARPRRHRADRIAVIGMFERQDARALLTRVAPIPKRHLQCDLDCRRSAIGKENVLETARCDLQKIARHGFGRIVGEAGKDNLVELISLLLDGAHDLRMPMPVRDDPPRRNAIEYPLPVTCFEPCPFGARDRAHLRFETVLCERVPDGRSHGPVAPTPRMSATEKFAAKALRKVVPSSGSSHGNRPRCFTAPKAAIVTFGIDDLVADEGNAKDRDRAALQGFDRKQRVIYRAELGRSAEDDRKLPLGEEVDLQQPASQRHRQPTR